MRENKLSKESGKLDISYNWHKNKQKNIYQWNMRFNWNISMATLFSSHIFNEWVMDKIHNAQLHINVRTDAKKKSILLEKKWFCSAHNRVYQNRTAAFFWHTYTQTYVRVPSVAVILTVWQIHLLFSKLFFSLTGAKPLNSTHQRDTCTCE